MTIEQSDRQDFAMQDVAIVGEKPLSWFDVSAIGTGEMVFSAGWAWIVFIASLHGIMWALIGFGGGVLVILAAWWLYREMITAVPEPGSIQSYGREAKLFPLGTAYFLLYAPVYGAFMWLEFQVASGLFHILLPPVPVIVWPLVVVAPVLILNLLGHQITGKVQAALVVITLVGDILVGVALWVLAADSKTWALNWNSPVPANWLTFFTVSGLWLGIMAGILEVQQVLVDEWREFKKSRDLGLMFGAVQLWVRQLVFGFGVMAVLPLTVLLTQPVPTVNTIEVKFGQSPLFWAALVTMLIATFTTFSVYFMAMGRILALYSMQGGLPRLFGRFSSRAVPWFSILVLAAFALVGAYWTNWSFITTVLSSWSVTLYFVIALFFLSMRWRNRTLERPHKAAYGVIVAGGLLLYTALIAVGVLQLNPQASLAWLAIVAAVIGYDVLVVPRTARGRHYRAQVLRPRESAERL